MSDDFQVPEGWKYIKILNFISESRISGSNGRNAKKITLKLYGKGVYPKNEKRMGSTATQYYIRKKGQFIYSKLDFLNGAFGVIPDSLDGYESTLDLPCFDFAENVSPKWFLEYVKRDDFYNKFAGLSNGGRKARRVNQSEFLDFELLTPPIEEQKKIASILTSVDDVIEKTEKQISKLQDLKKGMMTELLTKGIGHTEFKDSPVGRIPKSWKIFTLEKLAKIQSGIAKNKSLSGDNIIQIPYLRVANVQDGYLDLSEIKKIQINKDNLKRYLLQFEDVLVNEGGDFDKLGRGSIWNNQLSECVHQNHVFVVRTDKNKLLPQFFNHLSGSTIGKKYWLGCAKQTTNLASINASQLKKFQVILPSTKEQTKICNIIISIDKRIALCRGKYSQLKSAKKALMNDLLTGKKRVNVN